MTQFRTLLASALFTAFAIANGQTSAILGKLGQAVKQSSIYASPNSAARVYYTVQPYEYLVVQPAREKGWMKVFMSNGVYAYVDKDDVAQLPYDVVTKPRPRSSKSNTRGGRSVGNLTSRGAVANIAYQYNGKVSYVWGGNDLQKGIDCSGFVKKLFGEFGMSLPRTAAEQALVGKAITRYEDLRPGDRLYFWDSKRGKIGHTGIYLGATNNVGYFVHSSRGHNGVWTDPLTTKWQRILVAARR